MATTIERSSADGVGNVREVEVLLEGVQTPKRMQNPSDKKLGIVRHQFDVPIRALAGLDIYSGANPRKRPRVKSRVAQLIERSLLNEDGVVDGFHLAHLGITVVATSFEKVDDREDAFLLKFILDSEDEPSDGIVNGLHTLSVIDHVINSGIEISPGQYVSFTVITGITTEDRATIVPFIAKGRNTVLQVKTESIDNLMGRFDTLKAAIPDAYKDKIGWEESAGTDYDVIDVLARDDRPELVPVSERRRRRRRNTPSHRRGSQARLFEAIRRGTAGVRRDGAHASRGASLVRPDPVRCP